MASAVRNRALFGAAQGQARGWSSRSSSWPLSDRLVEGSSSVAGCRVSCAVEVITRTGTCDTLDRRSRRCLAIHHCSVASIVVVLV